MFRCPTCISVLTDPSSRRCQSCRQRLRRRGPRVLGEEHRLGARLLPIDRALNERLHRAAAARFQRTDPARTAPSAAPAPAPVWTPETHDLPVESTVDIALADTVLPTAAPFSAAPRHESLPVEPGPLDPDIQALVDDLYRRARDEIVGTFDEVAAADPAASAPQPVPARRRVWVPAVLTDRLHNDGHAIDELGLDGFSR